MAAIIAERGKALGWGDNKMDLQNKAWLWSKPELAGWMEKKGSGSSNWNRRFFLLQGSYLYYYTKNTDIPTSEPIGVIPLEAAEIVPTVELDTGSRRFCFLLQLNCELANFAKRPSYIMSTPSQQALAFEKELTKSCTSYVQNIWMRALDLASYSRLYIIGELQAVRENASLLRALLRESPSNLKVLETPQGHESRALQKEIGKVYEEYQKLKEEAKQACAQADKLKRITIQALAVWEIVSDHIAGRNRVGTCNTMNRLNAEASMTQELFKLLYVKGRLMNGEGIEDLSREARGNLQQMCKKGLRGLQERRAQVCAVAPRYASSIHPALLPRGYVEPLAKTPRAVVKEKHDRASLQRKESLMLTTRRSRASRSQQSKYGAAELSSKWKELQQHFETDQLAEPKNEDAQEALSGTVGESQDPHLMDQRRVSQLLSVNPPLWNSSNPYLSLSMPHPQSRPAEPQISTSSGAQYKDQYPGGLQLPRPEAPPSRRNEGSPHPSPHTLRNLDLPPRAPKDPSSSYSSEHSHKCYHQCGKHHCHHHHHHQHPDNRPHCRKHRSPPHKQIYCEDQKNQNQGVHQHKHHRCNQGHHHHEHECRPHQQGEHHQGRYHHSHIQCLNQGHRHQQFFPPQQQKGRHSLRTGPDEDNEDQFPSLYPGQKYPTRKPQGDSRYPSPEYEVPCEQKHRKPQSHH